jgi:hypothetical protein
MQIQIQLVGTTPLLQHNVQLADPDNAVVQEIKAITGKRKKTEDDRRAIEKLEWFGGLYIGENGPVMPTSMIRKCLINAARITKAGKQVERALLFSEFDVPLVYEGPRKPEDLFKDAKFHHRAMVGVQRAKTVRVRPKFPKWAVTAKAELLTDVLDLDELKRILALAGTAEGVGDGRSIGFGRFVGEVKAA